MKIALFFNAYQPVIQEEYSLKRRYSDCFFPLLRFVKSKKSSKFTLNVPLSTLEAFDGLGEKEWISDLKNLYRNEKLDLTGSAAYYPLLTKIPAPLVEEQIILNEYGLGYYLGAHQGFEGESSIMVKDIRGFFPPELALNSGLIKILTSLGYDWVIADPSSISDPDMLNKSSVFAVNDLNVNLLLSNREIAGELLDIRDLDITRIVNKVTNTDSDTLLLSFDVASLTQNKEFFSIMDMFVDKLSSLGHSFVSVSEMLEYSDIVSVDSDVIKDSTWRNSDIDIKDGDVKKNSNPYNFWEDEENELSKKLWDLENIMIKAYSGASGQEIDSDLANIPIWDFDTLENLDSVEGLDFMDLKRYVFLHKFLLSDKYLLYPGVTSGSPRVSIKNLLDLSKNYAGTLEDKKVSKVIEEASSAIELELL